MQKESTLAALEESLVLSKDRLASWLVTAAISALCFVMRLVDLARPSNLMFDETYYAKDAWTLLQRGAEMSWPEDANAQVVAGNVDIFTDKASFVVHPQLGKWLIAAGEQLFGMNSFGWRIASVVFGTLMIIAVIRLARRLSRSTLIGALAGLLLCFDGLHFVMSRIALLDIFEATFTVLAVACVVADRDWFQLKLAGYLRANSLANLGGCFGPRVWWRPWRLAAGVMFGCAIACKWNALYVLAAMGLLSVAFDYTSRKLAGAGDEAIKALTFDAPLAFLKMVVTAAVVYLASWASWLADNNGWGRDWGAKNPEDPLVKAVGAPLASLWQYHRQIYDFHTGDYMAEQTHTYEAHPATWPVMGRTIGIDAVNGIQPGTDGCQAEAGDTCLRVISGLGTPILWWVGLLAILAGLVFWLAGHDWRFAVVTISWAVPWLAWFPNADRPLFFFYAIMMIPFTCIGLALVAGKIIGKPTDRRRRVGTLIVAAFVVLVILNFWFFYPVLTDQLMTRDAWSLRMWFRSWI